MKTSVKYQHLVRVLLVTAWLISSAATANEGERPILSADAMLSSLAMPVAGVPSPPREDATDLKFHEFFKLPVGPRGLEATEKLKSLAGKRIRMVGYMARQEIPTAGFFVLSPLPVSLGDEDESLADDLPASVVFVHVHPPGDKPLPFSPGLLRVTGILSIGAHEESDGHVSSVRLQLDPEIVQALAAGQRPM
ncbi:MAG: hypothetical protein NT159_11745 [Proteobacteria bacterium]|nr:hypothetical protein [Pseudomonadota bacterium]